jgi:hypothetical protein
MWKQGRVSKDWFADYLGLSARVRVHPETGKATEISWYISDKVETVSPVSATVDVAKRIAKKLIDHQIASEAKWAQAEQRWQRGFFFGDESPFTLRCLRSGELPGSGLCRQRKADSALHVLL